MMTVHHKKDLDVGNAKELYGDGSEGVNLKSGFDLTTIKVTKKSYVMGKQFTLDKKTVFRITGSQGDDESSNSGFSVVADAEKCKAVFSLLQTHKDCPFIFICSYHLRICFISSQSV